MAIETVDQDASTSQGTPRPWEATVPTALAGGLAAVAAYSFGAMAIVDEGVGLILALGVGVLVQAAVQRAPAASVSMDEVQAGWHHFAVELDRARRHERPLAVIRISPPADTSRSEADRKRELARQLRSVDRAWIDGDDIYILLPESDSAAGQAMLSRIGRLGSSWVGEARMAAFPDDGITTAALLAALRGRPVGATAIPRLRDRSEDVREAG